MRLAVAAAICLSMVGLAVAAESQAAMTKMPTNIPAQGLGPALKTLAKNRGFQVVFRSEVVGSARTQGASGNLTAPEALTKLLKGTDLSYSYLDENTVTIVPSAPTATSAVADQSQTTQSTSGGNGKNSSQDFRVAQVDQTAIGPQVDNDQNSQKKKKEEGLTEIVVTGSHIRGEDVASSSPVQTIDRTAIEESGYQTTGDLIRSLPQSFSGGQNPGIVSAAGSQNTPSVSSGSSANLRGLGCESTLSLVDSHRLAYDGFQSSVDVSLIPLAAVDHVDVVTDGASAVYGSDAVAGVVNFVLRRHYSGAETTLDVGYPTQGGGVTKQASQLVGGDWGSGDAMLAYEYFDQSAVYASQRGLTDPLLVLSPQTLYPSTLRNSVFADLNQTVTERVSVFAEALYSTRDVQTESLGVGLQQPVKVQQYGAVAGVNLSIVGDWVASISGNASGTSDKLQEIALPFDPQALVQQQNYANHLWSIDLNLDGSVVDTGAGTIKLAGGAGFRKESISIVNLPANPFSPDTDADRRVRYGFLELRAPLLGSSDPGSNSPTLELTAAGRYEDYSDFGHSLNPKVGIAFLPTRDLKLRATWATSFRAPSLAQVYGPTQAYLFDVPNPASPTGQSQILDNTGGNPALGPEKSTSVTAGLDFKPKEIPGLALNLTFYDIHYRQRISFLPNAFAIFTDPTLAPFVIQSPSAALVESVVAKSLPLLNVSAEPYDPSKLAALAYGQYLNLARQEARGVDLLVSEEVAVSRGTLTFALNTAYLDLTQQVVSDGPEETISGTVFNPAKFRIRGSAAWHFGDWSTAAFVNYLGSSYDPSQIPRVQVASWTTMDAQIAYTPSFAKWSRGLRLSLSGQNLLDRNPPYVASSGVGAPGFHYDYANASALGRVLSFNITKAW